MNFSNLKHSVEAEWHIRSSTTIICYCSQLLANMHKYRRAGHSILYKCNLHSRVTTETVSAEVVKTFVGVNIIYCDDMALSQRIYI